MVDAAPFSVDLVVNYKIYEVAKNMAEHGSVAMSFNVHDMDAHRGVDGRYYSPYGIGHPLYAVPFYLAGRSAEAENALDRQLRLLGAASSWFRTLLGKDAGRRCREYLDRRAINVDVFNRWTSMGSIFFEFRGPLGGSDRSFDKHHKFALGFRWLF